MHWQPGQQIVQYEMLGRGIGLARPVTVVDDGSKQIILYSHPGTRIATRGIPGYRSLGLSERIEVRNRMLNPCVGDFRQAKTPDDHVLTITPHDSWHSVMLFWTSEWDFRAWYVNFQSPIRRVRHGIQYEDCALDIVVRPDLDWKWKDKDEFEQLVDQLFFNDDHVSRIRAEASSLVRKIESVALPFSDPWEHWRPHPNWPVPELPNDWSDLGQLGSAD